MLAKAKNGHTNIWYILLLNFVATYNIRSPTQDSEKEIVLCKKGDDITRFDGICFRVFNFDLECLKWVQHILVLLAQIYLITSVLGGRQT
jgi:hypothetical protein